MRAAPRAALAILGTVGAALLLAACGGDAGSAAPASAPVGGAHATDTAAGRVAGAAGATTPGNGGSSADDNAPPRSSTLHVRRTEAFYDVTGHTAAALLDELAHRGPRVGGERAFGRTAWTARWQITYQEAPGSEAGPCRLRHADVHLDVEVTLPRWNAPSTAPAPLQRDWGSFVDALVLHEREHRESIVSAGQRVARALELLEAPTCAALEAKAEATVRPIIEKARAYNRRYDERTGHGRTQGARWPPP